MSWKDFLMNPLTITTLIGLAGAAMTWLSKDNAAKRKAEIAWGVQLAFHALQDWDKLEPSTWATTATNALKVVDSYLQASGWAPLAPGEKTAATITLSGLTGMVAKSAAIASAAAPTVASPH